MNTQEVVRLFFPSREGNLIQIKLLKKNSYLPVTKTEQEIQTHTNNLQRKLRSKQCESKEKSLGESQAVAVVGPKIVM